MKKGLLFFFLLYSFGCNKNTSKNKIDRHLPGTSFIDALLIRDTALLRDVLDPVSIRNISLYSVPQIKITKDLHYKLVISKQNFNGLVFYRYVIVFPWKDVFMLYLVPSGNKWSLLPVYVLKNRYEYKIDTLSNVIMYYNPSLNPIEVSSVKKWLSEFKKKVCQNCKTCCPDSLVYIYDPSGKPAEVFGELDGLDENYYKRGLCFSRLPYDTFGVMEALLDHDKYLYSIVKGYYLYKYTNHRVLGHDVGDWLKSEILASSIKYFPPDIIQNMVFYKPLAGAFGYVLIDYLKKKKVLDNFSLEQQLFDISSELKRIVKNQGSNILFLRKYTESLVDTSFTSVFSQLAKFIVSSYNDISIYPDTIRFIRDKKRNITFVLSSRYGKDGIEVVNSFQSWIDSLDFFHKPYYTFLLVPAWLADSFSKVLTPANSYWTALFEYKEKGGVLNEMKREYTIYLIGNLIKTYSIQQKQLPLWVSLGAPVYFQNGNRCNIRNYEDIFRLKRSLVEHFYETSLGDLSPRVSIWLSYKMLCVIDHLHPGVIPDLIEKSISNMDFKTTYKEVTGRDLSEVFKAWRLFVRDTLFYRVSRK